MWRPRVKTTEVLLKPTEKQYIEYFWHGFNWIFKRNMIVRGHYLSEFYDFENAIVTKLSQN